MSLVIGNEEEKELESQNFPYDFPIPKPLTSTNKEKPQLKMVLLQLDLPNLANQEGKDELKCTTLQANQNQMNEISMVEWCCQKGEMVSQGLIQTNISEKRLQSMIPNLEKKLKHERVIS